ncbi:MAG: hypothetical protein EXX96DRAFT_614237 [Benjaminiella poitrasii]|nr:MAG: hypothetical protein EXX96DRAFT_614237 [Benjaminiella poitrasii]
MTVQSLFSKNLIVSNSPTFKLARDIHIRHQASSSIIKQHEMTTWKPLSVAVVLSKVQYIGSSSRLILSGHISKSNADRISDVSMANLDTMTIQFDTFTYDESNSKWYSKFKSGNSNGISGRVAKIEVVQQRYGKDTYQELSIELLPLPKVSETPPEHFDYSATSILPTAEIKWNGLEAYECQKSYNEKINSAKRKEHFYEVIESAVLF